MRRDYIESMKASGFGEFLQACESLRNCKYVIAEQKIAAVLKSIADNKQLYSMFSVSLYGFNYKLVFSECVNSGNFSLPDDAKKAIALVFRILLDIDDGKISLQNFLEAYFYSVSINESYARFCLEVIAPFEKYCRTMFSRADAFFDIAAANNNLIYEDDVSGKLHSELKTDALNCLTKLIDISEKEITGSIDRAEFQACLKGLTQMIDSDDYNMIISTFLGVKYAVAYFFKANRLVQELYKKLEYDVKHLAD